MDPYPSERVVIARHPTTDGEIQLQRRQQPDGSLAYEIIADGVFLMASYNQVSEKALAECVLPSVMARPLAERRLLVGGLGMGYTLQATLSAALFATEGSTVEAVDVVEFSPHIVEWNRTHFAALNGDVLKDPRVTIIQDDLYTVMNRSPRSSYCAILLDVDNGPSWLAHPGNARLYTDQALRRWSALLMPGGILAVWSAQVEPDLLRRMTSIFGKATETIVVANERQGEPVETYIYRGS